MFTKEDSLEGIRLWEELEKQDRLFEKYYWREVIKQAAIGREKLEREGSITYREVSDLFNQASADAWKKVEEELNDQNPNHKSEENKIEKL